MSFVHLHVHSTYSLLDGLAKISDLIQRAQELHMPALGLTDHGVMYGAVEFYDKAKKAGIKPIIGVEAYVAPNGHKNKNSKLDTTRYHLILLAQNYTGYKNLIQLTSRSHLDGYYYKPRIDHGLLEQYHEGLIAASACLNGEIPRAILAGQIDKAEQLIKWHQQTFGLENFYLEIQYHPHIPEVAQVNQILIELSQKHSTPLIATNDVHYVHEADAQAQDILICLQTKKKQADTDRMRYLPEKFYLTSLEEMSQFFKDQPAALANTLAVAEKCQLDLPLNKNNLPTFPVPHGLTDFDFLTQLCHHGLKLRYRALTEPSPEILTRLNYELSVIEKTGFAAYFLIVHDFIHWAKQQGIVVGPGRGSAAGSLVAYLLQITDVDPIKYELLFERFLNPERISLPDIDTDFADTRRDEVLNYVTQKYGQDRVCQIITFGTMAARAAVRDVGRVIDLPYAYCDQIAKMIPASVGITIQRALDTNPELKNLYEADPQCRHLLDMAKRLEGVSRHASTHACGVVITPGALTDYLPIQHDTPNGTTIISQYSMNWVEKLGLLKMDFLGLKNLTILETATRLIQANHNITLDLKSLDLNDSLTLELFQRGDTTGVFQFESSGMKRYLHELRPTDLEDIVAMVSLYRPGPMELIPDYIAGKKGLKQITYLHPKLEPILKKTYGIAVYQEQIMQMARDLAGFSLAEADVLRKAMGKKIKDLLAEQRDKFIQGCKTENGLSQELAEKIFSFVEPFARYGFNRSHAVCYALIAYQTAYLKAHYPAEFMAALMTADQHNTDRVVIDITEAERLGLKVLSPDINESSDGFTVTGDKMIHFGLKAIKNVGDHVAEVIIKEREKNGHYQDLRDLAERISDKDWNKKSLEGLIKAGALDYFNDRGLLLANLEKILQVSKTHQQELSSGQVNLFGSLPQATVRSVLRLDPVSPPSLLEKLRWEKEALGLYLSDHPLAPYSAALAGKVYPLSRVRTFTDRTRARVAGIITASKKIFTKTQEPMLFVSLEDNSGTLECLVFPKLYQTTHELWSPDNLVLVTGVVSLKDGEAKILTDTVALLGPDAVKLLEPLTDATATTPPAPTAAEVSPVVMLTLPATTGQETLKKLRDLLIQYPGEWRVQLIFNHAINKQIQTPLKIAYCPELVLQVKKLLVESSLQPKVVKDNSL